VSRRAPAGSAATVIQRLCSTCDEEVQRRAETRAPASVQRQAADAPAPVAEEDRVPANRGLGVITVPQLIRDVETIEQAYPERSPQEILTMIRSLYYGSPAGSSEFDRLIPDAPQTGAVQMCADDEGRLCHEPVGVCVCHYVKGVDTPTPRLLKAIQRLSLHADENGSGDNPSPYVLVGEDLVDLGHVLVGLDAILHPDPRYLPFGRSDITSAPEVATWIGDVGSAMVYLREQRTRNGHADPGGSPQSEIEQHYQVAAPSSDLLGDADAYGVPFGYCKPLSVALREYYVGSAGALPSVRYRWHLFAETNSLVYRVHGGKVVWDPQTQPAVIRKLSKFASFFAQRGDFSALILGPSISEDYPNAGAFADRFLKDVKAGIEAEIAAGAGKAP